MLNSTLLLTRSPTFTDYLYMVFRDKNFPVYLNVNSARKSLGIKITRGKKAEKSTKEQILEWVDVELQSYDWPNKILKSGPRKGCVVLESGCYDMADSYVIARAGQMNI